MKILKFLSVFSIITAVICSNATVQTSASNQKEFSYIGSGTPGYKDGELADAQFYMPYGISEDIEGNIIVVDTYNNRIRYIKNNTVYTLVGTSSGKDSFGFPSGGYIDDEALKAEFNKPRDAVVDSKGNIFVSDTGNHVIREISNGRVYTFAGSGKKGYLDGNAHEACFNTPSGITIDKEDNLYVADTLNNVIRKISTTGEVSTYAGKYLTKGSYMDGPLNEAMFNEPADIIFTPGGDFYVTDSGNQLIRKITKDTVITIAGEIGDFITGTSYVMGGYENGFTSRFNFPKGLCAAEDGTIFVADTKNHKIRAIKPDGKVMTILGTDLQDSGGDTAYEIKLNNPVGIFCKSGILYITDMWNNRLISIPITHMDLSPKFNTSYYISGIEFKPLSDNIQVWFNKQLVQFPDVQPFIKNNKTYVPLRFICEKWGAEVKWIESSSQVQITKGSFNKIYSLNDNIVINKDGRTMIQLRDLADSMGLYVDWVSEYKAAIISSK